MKADHSRPRKIGVGCPTPEPFEAGRGRLFRNGLQVLASGCENGPATCAGGVGPLPPVCQNARLAKVDLLILFPFLAWIAVITSAALLVMLWAVGELGLRGATVLLVWCLVAAYCQFFGASAILATAGLVLQTVLAIYLAIRWKLSTL